MDLRETLQAVDNVSGHAFLGRHSDTLQIGRSIPLAERSAELVFNLDEVLGGDQNERHGTLSVRHQISG
jgi:hypothetical protein